MPKSVSGAGARILVRCALAFGTPLLLGTYALFPGRILLPYLALVPWILLYTDDRPPAASFWWFPPAAFLTWVLQYTALSRFGWFAGPAMASVMFVTWLPFPFVMRAVHRRFRWPRAFSAPLVWVGLEWFRLTFTLAHFDLYAIGYSQARIGPLVQIADLTGVYGVSFLVAMGNGLVADLVTAWRDRRSGWPDTMRRPRLAREASIVAGAFALALAYGAFRLSTVEERDGPRLAVVQPDIEHSTRNTVGVHLSEVLFTNERVPPGVADLIIWPENSILDNVRRPGIYLPDLGRLAKDKGALLLVGGMGKVASDPGRTTNTAFLVDSSGAVLGEASKRLLFPWSERIPADDFLRRFAPPLWRLQRAVVRLAWGFVPTGVPGEGVALLNLPWQGTTLPFGVLICVENVYPPAASEQALRGARFLVTMTSEKTIGGPVQEQLLRISMLRAIENRIAFVRCGNSGISAFIDARGITRKVLRGDHGGTIFDRGVLVDRVPLTSGGPTVYARSHDAFGRGCFGLALALGLAATLRPARRLPIAGLAAAALAFHGCAAPPLPGRDTRAAPAALEEGRDRLAKGDAKGAIAPLAAACADPAPCREAIPLISSALQATRRFEDGDAFFAALAKARPEIAGAALVERGLFLDRLAELREAEDVTAEAARLDPRPGTWTALGTLRMRMDEPEAALQAYGKALELAPSDPQVRYLHGRALWLAGRGDEATRELTALVEEHPDIGAAWAVLGRIRDAAGGGAPAQDAYRRAIAGDPENVEARLMLARDAMTRGQEDEAKRWLGEIWAINTRAEGRTGSPATAR